MRNYAFYYDNNNDICPNWVVIVIHFITSYISHSKIVDVQKIERKASFK